MLHVVSWFLYSFVVSNGGILRSFNFASGSALTKNHMTYDVSNSFGRGRNNVLIIVALTCFRLYTGYIVQGCDLL